MLYSLRSVFWAVTIVTPNQKEKNTISFLIGDMVLIFCKNLK